MNALCHLDHYGFLAVTGKDAVKFLQGYTTCDLDRLTDNTSMIGAICNLQGRMLTSFRAVRIENGILLRMDRPLVAVTITFLSKYIVFSKATLADMSEDWRCFGVFTSTSTAEMNVTRDTDSIVICLEGRKEIYASDQFPAPAVPEGMVLEKNDWLKADVDQGIAWVTENSSAEFLPQMFDYHLHGAIHFDKGCYLGQEIVARAQYRGSLKKRLHRLSSGKFRDIGTKVGGGMVVGTAGDREGDENGHDHHLLAVVTSDGNVIPGNAIEGVSVSFDDGENVLAYPCQLPIVADKSS